ncbi:putative quinol monooxygenase [Streptomyces iconiensis]|uniref:Antibiotic biosynthesis monooxygenase n=1 Tax=Streptomyces iconiensis TaxID=1384038 RepID=A0ABT7A3B2_9ACTN|nr:antibiotic biosynthesis monooxygenase [Streptomyces iconiensis]MDJ1135833.1 antibiotic biosynthesis monooxygenase [Streptomyces iconiensis]
MFCLMVRFTCKNEQAATAFDELVERTAEQIKAHEHGTLVYTAHRVEGRPLERIVYELYRDQLAFEAHESQDYVKEFLSAREQYLSVTQADRLEFVTGKGVGA